MVSSDTSPTIIRVLVGLRSAPDTTLQRLRIGQGRAGHVEGRLRPASRRALAFICCKRAGCSKSRESLWANVGRLFTFTPAPFSKTKSLLRVSWPGTGLAIKRAAPRAKTSEVVNPPGLESTMSAAAINSSISRVKPITVARWREGTSICSNRDFSSSLRPATTTTCKGRSTESTPAKIFSTGPMPKPPAICTITGRSLPRPRRWRQAGSLSPG